MVVSHVHLQRQEKQSDDLSQQEYKPVKIHSTIDSTLNNIFVIIVDSFHLSVLVLYLAVNVRVIVEQGLRPRENGGMEELDEDKLAFVKREKCQCDAAKH